MATFKVPLRFTDGTVKELNVSSTTTVADLKAQLGVRAHYAQNWRRHFRSVCCRVLPCFWVALQALNLILDGDKMEDDDTFDDLPVGSGAHRSLFCCCSSSLKSCFFTLCCALTRGSCRALVPAAVRVILKKAPVVAGGDGVAPVAAAASSTGAAGGSGST